MDAFQQDRGGFYPEPNFSFEDTFCRQITSCLEYEQDTNVNICHKGQENLYRLNQELVSSNLHLLGEAISQATSTNSKQCRIHELQPIKRASAQTPSESSLFEDKMVQGLTDMLSYQDEQCDDVESCEQSSSSTWSTDQDVNNAMGCARVRLEPMKRIRRLRANDRERRRMRSLNRALDSLKKCIPVPPSKRKVTKLEILRIACSYIRSLSDTLRGEAAGTTGAFRKRARPETVVNGFSVAQRLEILSTSK